MKYSPTAGGRLREGTLLLLKHEPGEVERLELLAGSGCGAEFDPYPGKRLSRGICTFSLQDFDVSLGKRWLH